MLQKDNSLTKLLSQIKFKMDKKLGEGRFSIVKLGTHSLTNQPVAIKILDKTKISNLGDKERINREIKIMKKINHFNITKLYTIIETQYIIYLVQEYVQGKELNDYLYTKGKLSETDACKFFHQIISGLSYLHYIGIAHRDFKPENILLTNDHKILKIIDFGLSNTYKKGQLLKTGCGSPCYIPPEMIKEEKYNAEKTDIWSAGIILYLMLCGHLPFYEEDNQIMYDKIIKGDYDIPQFLSEEAKDIIKKILEVDPKKRLNFEEIKNHPWFNIINKKYMIYKGFDIDADIIPIDEDIVEQMEKLGINKIETRYHILKNYHNKITTIYNLLLKKKIDSGKKSISDMQSDLYNEYINNKKNKITYYGNLDSVLKNRIGNGNKVMNKLPSWAENEYETDNENMIIGDNGSVMERLIKAGKFIYDEEKMCVSKVTNIYTKISKRKGTLDNDGENKYKTISAISSNVNKKIKKLGSVKLDEEKTKMKIKSNHKVHFKDENENENNKEMNNNNFMNLKKVKTEIKKGKIEEEDWYKEMEKLIDEENNNHTQTINKNNNNKHKQIRAIKSTKFTNTKKDELKVSSFYLDKDNKESKKYQNQFSSPLISKISNVHLKKSHTRKVSNNNNNNNNPILPKNFKLNNIKNPSNFIKTGKVVKKEGPKIKDASGKVKKRQKSLDKNTKNKNDKDLEKEIVDNFEIKQRRRNQSFQKRNRKMKI